MTVSNGTLIANSLIIGTNGPVRGVLDVVGGTVIIARSDPLEWIVCGSWRWHHW